MDPAAVPSALAPLPPRAAVFTGRGVDLAVLAGLLDPLADRDAAQGAADRWVMTFAFLIAGAVRGGHRPGAQADRLRWAARLDGRRCRVQVRWSPEYMPSRQRTPDAMNPGMGSSWPS
jgi:hypothetical protein